MSPGFFDRHADRSLRLGHNLWLWKYTLFTESVIMTYIWKSVNSDRKPSHSNKYSIHNIVLYTVTRLSDRHADRSLRLEHILWLWKSTLFTDSVNMLYNQKSVTPYREPPHPYQYSIHNIILCTVTRLLDRHADRSLRLEHILWLWKSTFTTESVTMICISKSVT